MLQTKCKGKYSFWILHIDEVRLHEIFDKSDTAININLPPCEFH